MEKVFNSLSLPFLQRKYINMELNTLICDGLLYEYYIINTLVYVQEEAINQSCQNCPALKSRAVTMNGATKPEQYGENHVASD